MTNTKGIGRGFLRLPDPRMTTVVSTLVAILMLVLPVTAQNTTANLESFEMVWHTVNKKHFDPSFGGVDWRAMHERYLPQIAVASSTEEFTRITNQMLFELKLSHLIVASEEMLKTYMPALFAEGTVGLDIRWMQSKTFITRVKPGFPGQTEGLRAGYVITHINDRDVDDIIQQAQVMPPYNARNLRGGITNYLVGHIDGPPDTTVSLRYLDENMQSNKVVLTRQSRGDGMVVSKAMPPVFIDFESQWLEGNIGCIRFNHFASPVDKAFLKALETMRDTRGLIFDMRGNPGGYFSILDTIVEHLISKKTSLYEFHLRGKRTYKTLNPSKNPYLKPVVVLIDTTSTSASEHFAACLQAIGRAVIIGERSPGYLLGAQWLRLPNGLSFMHTVLQPVTVDKRIIEGNGVTPDIEVTLDHSALLAGRDNQLEAAVAHILKMSMP